MKEMTDTAFATDVLASPRPVVVDFWAPWCGPCRMIAPALEELSSELAGQVDIVKMNIDDHPETPSSLGIRSIPTLMLFKDGKQVSVITGAQPKSSIKTWIEGGI